MGRLANIPRLLRLVVPELDSASQIYHGSLNLIKYTGSSTVGCASHLLRVSYGRALTASRSPPACRLESVCLVVQVACAASCALNARTCGSSVLEHQPLAGSHLVCFVVCAGSLRLPPRRLLFGSQTLAQWTKKLEPEDTRMSPSSPSSPSRRSSTRRPSDTTHDAPASVKRRASSAPAPVAEPTRAACEAMKPDAVCGVPSKVAVASEARDVDRAIAVKPTLHHRRGSLSDKLLEGVMGMESLITTGTLPGSVLSGAGGTHHSRTPSVDVAPASPVKMVRQTVRYRTRFPSVCDWVPGR